MGERMGRKRAEEIISDVVLWQRVVLWECVCVTCKCVIR